MEITKREWMWLMGIVVAVILATNLLKKFFNMPTSGALCCIFIVIGIFYLGSLLIKDYLDYKKREE